MPKIRKSFMLILLLLLMAAVLVACNPGEEENQGSLALKNDVAIVFVQGEVDLSSIEFYLLDKDGAVVSTHTLTAEMLSAADLASLSFVRSNPVVIRYGGYTLSITINILEKQTPTIYTLTFDAGEGTFAAGVTSDPAAHTYTVTTQDLLDKGQTSVMEIPSPHLENYDFLGWFTGKNGQGSPVAEPYSLTATHTVYAHWEHTLKHTVTLQNSRYQTYTVTVAHGNSYTLPTAEIPAGYNFDGWKTGDITYPAGTVIATVTENLTYTAIYTAITYKLTFTADSSVPGWETPIVIENVAINSAFNVNNLPSPAIFGKTYTWMDTQTERAPLLTGINRDMNIVCVYEDAVYRLNFYRVKQGASLTNPTFPADYEYLTHNDVLHGASVQAGGPSVPVEEGHVGTWYYNSNGEHVAAAALLGAPITAARDIYVRYVVQTYALTYIFGEGTPGGARQPVVLHLPYQTYVDAPLNISEEIDAKYYTTAWSIGYAAFEPFYIKTPTIVTATHTPVPYTAEFRYPALDTDGNPIDYANALFGYGPDQPTIRTGITPGGGGKVIPPNFDLSPQYEIISWTTRNNKGEVVPIEPSAFATMNITDFCEYNENPALDRSFEAVVAVRTYTVAYYTLATVLLDNSYAYTLLETKQGVRYGTKISFAAGAGLYELPTYVYDNAANIPGYESGADNTQFNFRGWHAGSDMSTELVDFTTGYTVEADVSFYTEWLDLKYGTRGLQFERRAGGYYLVGFTPAVEYTAFDSLVIPAAWEGEPLIGITADAFADAFAYSIRSLVLPSSITDIEAGAFKALRGLEEFVWLGAPAQGYRIVNGAIYALVGEESALLAYPSAKNDTAFSVPNSVDGKPLTAVLPYAVFANEYLESIAFDVDSALTTIAAYAFASCAALTEIVLPATLVTVEDNAFAGSYYLETVTFAKEGTSLRNITAEAVADTAWYRNAGDEVILQNVLIKYRGAAATYTLDNSIVVVADYAFAARGTENAYSLTTFIVTTSANLERIGYRAFYGTNVTYIQLLRGVAVEIGDEAFGGTLNITRTMRTAAQGLTQLYDAMKDRIGIDNVTHL